MHWQCKAKHLSKGMTLAEALLLVNTRDRRVAPLQSGSRCSHVVESTGPNTLKVFSAQLPHDVDISTYEKLLFPLQHRAQPLVQLPITAGMFREVSNIHRDDLRAAARMLRSAPSGALSEACGTALLTKTPCAGACTGTLACCLALHHLQQLQYKSF